MMLFKKKTTNGDMFLPGNAALTRARGTTSPQFAPLEMPNNTDTVKEKEIKPKTRQLQRSETEIENFGIQNWREVVPDISLTESQFKINNFEYPMVQTIIGGVVGYKDGKNHEAKLNCPTCLIEDSDGNIWIGDQCNCKIRTYLRKKERVNNCRKRWFRKRWIRENRIKT